MIFGLPEGSNPSVGRRQNAGHPKGPKLGTRAGYRGSSCSVQSC